MELEIAELFDGMCRTQPFFDEILKSKGEITRAFRSVYNKQYFGQHTEIITKLEALGSSVKSLARSIENLPSRYDVDASEVNLDIIVDSITKEFEEFDRLARQYVPPERERTTHSQSSEETQNTYNYNLRKLGQALRGLEQVIGAKKFTLYKQPQLWISGPAGNGKTHLLCDVAKKRMEEDLPTILVLGQQLADVDLWAQLCRRIGINASGDHKAQFLLETASLAETYQNKVLILIDAVNEGAGVFLWPKILKHFFEEIARTKHLAIAFTCRTSYEHLINPPETILKIEHRGFERNLFQATKSYFEYYKIKSHEIPLIGEFANPLFLKTYCEALQEYELTSTVRGLVGLKSIHEQYCNSVDRRLSARLKFPRSIKTSHAISKLIASEMAQHGKEWVSFPFFLTAVETVKQKAGLDLDLATELLHEGLLTRDFYFDPVKQSDEEGIRFGFQRFSDVFVVREILIKNGISKTNITRRFSKTPAIKALFERSYQNSNLIEALAIMIPEWTKGRHEILNLANELCPPDLLIDSYLTSLVWRDFSAFPSDRKLRNDLNSVINFDISNLDKVFSLLLSVSTTPEHPLNADFLHQRLLHLKMPIRDSAWLPYLHNHYDEDGVIPRVIEWAWQLDFKQTSEESLRLLAVTLSWCFTSSNRFLRDRSTKALVLILSSKPELAEPLFVKFSAVDDPYVVERILQGIYGALARVGPELFVGAAKQIYKQFYVQGPVPQNFLIRHYSKIIIRRCKKFAPKAFDDSRIIGPFRTEWPRRVASKATIRKKFESFPYEGGDPRWALSVIHSSVMGYGDFARYVIGSDFGSRWRLRKHLTFEEELQRLRSKLKKKIDKEFFDLVIKFQKIKGSLEQKNSEDALAIKGFNKLTKEVLTKFSDKDRRSLSKILKRVSTAKRGEGGVFVPIETIQRMVMSRISELGYSAKLHGRFDRNSDHGNYERRANKSERIGKKYQWLAYFDVVGLLTDHCIFSDYEGEKHEIFPRDLSGLDQLDPTVTLRGEKDLPKMDRKIEIKFPNYESWKTDLSNEDWLKDSSDLYSMNEIIEVMDNQNRKWLILDGGYFYKQKIRADEDRYEIARRDLFYILNSYIVKKSDLPKIAKFLEKTSFIGRWMPESHEQTSPHFADFYSELERQYDLKNGFWSKDSSLPFSFILPTEQYMYEKGTFDCSIDETLHLSLPSFFLANGMQIKLGDYDGVYRAITSENVVAINFSNDSCSGLAFNKEALMEFLEKNNLSIFWVCISEKNMIGGSDTRKSAIGRLELSSGCILKEGLLEEVGRKVEYKSFNRS